MAHGATLPVKPETGGKVAEGYSTPKADQLVQRMVIPPKRVLPIIFLPGIMGSNLRMNAERQALLKKSNNIAWRPEDKTESLALVFSSAARRQSQLDPDTTEVDSYDPITNPTGDTSETSYDRHGNIAIGTYYSPLCHASCHLIFLGDNMSKVYSDAFIEQALVKVFSRGTRTVQDVADDLHVNYYTVKNWIRRKNLFMLKASSDREKRPQDWSRSEQLVALHETHALDQEALQGWCRERGLFVHHLEEWRTAFCLDTKPVNAAVEIREVRTLQRENDKLKKDLDRKDKALAEAAALLLLQKKFNALWEDEVK